MAQISKQLKKNEKLYWAMKNHVGDNMHQQINMKGGVKQGLDRQQRCHLQLNIQIAHSIIFLSWWKICNFYIGADQRN